MKTHMTLLVFIFPLILITVLLAAPFLIIQYLSGGTLSIDYQEISKQYFQFVLGILSMMIGFFVANIAWDNKQFNAKMRREKKVILRFLRQIKHLTLRGITLLESNNNNIDWNNDEDIDTNLVKTFQLMALAQQGILLHYPEDEIERDQEFSEVIINVFWNSIVPKLHALSSISQVRGNTQKIKIILQELEQSINDLLKYLEKA